MYFSVCLNHHRLIIILFVSIRIIFVLTLFYQEEEFLKAAEEGRVDEVARLLDQGVDIQCKDEVRYEPIDHSLAMILASGDHVAFPRR